MKMQDEKKKCSQCGFLNNIDAEKCIYCGSVSFEKNEELKKPKKWIFFLGGLILIVVVLCAIFFIN